MLINDQIGDMLTRIRNAGIVRHETVEMPTSKMKLAVLKVLKDEGFITDYELVKAKPEKLVRIRLRFDENKKSMISGIERVSKPGLRVYTERNRIPRVQGGVGVAILSTPRGIVTGHQARHDRVGGEVLCYVW